MKVRVDPERCQGHCRCIAVAEDLFEADDLGYAHAIGDGSVRPDQLERAQLAVNNCPEYAVVLELGP
ncbi:MAG: ferredoxin [Actinomycetota bacterium]